MIAASAWLAALAATIAPITKEIFLSKVEVAGPDGRWTLLAEPRDGDVHVVALTAISPLLPRVEVRRGRSTPVTPGPALSAQVEVAVNAGNRPLDCAPRLTAVIHGVDEELLLVEGELLLDGLVPVGMYAYAYLYAVGRSLRCTYMSASCSGVSPLANREPDHW